MKNIFKTLFVLAMVAALCAVPAFAQTATYQTVTTAAQTANSTTVTLLSTTNMTASSQTVTSLMFCDGEAYKINSFNSTSGVVQVTRGYDVTNASAHVSGVPCFYGVQGGQGQNQLFVTASQNGFGGNADRAPISGGVCTRTDYAFLPKVNIQNNSLVDCAAASVSGSTPVYRWRETSLAMFTGSDPLTSVNDAAYTITLSDKYVRLANATASRTFTLPPVTQIFGHVVVVKHDAQTGTLTVAAPSGQYVTTVGTTSTTTSSGGTIKLMSVQAQSGAWGWMTIQ